MVNKKTKKSQKEYLREKYILMLQLRERVKNEPTPFGKLLFLENEISCSVIATLNTIGKYVYENENKFKYKVTKDKLPMLGNLIKILNEHINDNELKKALIEFNTRRNNITHNMLSVYKDISEIDIDSMLTVIWGNKILELLDEFRINFRNVK